MTLNEIIRQVESQKQQVNTVQQQVEQLQSEFRSEMQEIRNRLDDLDETPEVQEIRRELANRYSHYESRLNQLNSMIDRIMGVRRYNYVTPPGEQTPYWVLAIRCIYENNGPVTVQQIVDYVSESGITSNASNVAHSIRNALNKPWFRKIPTGEKNRIVVDVVDDKLPSTQSDEVASFDKNYLVDEMPEDLKEAARIIRR